MELKYLKLIVLVSLTLSVFQKVKGQGYMYGPVTRGAVWAFFPDSDQSNPDRDYANSMSCTVS